VLIGVLLIVSVFTSTFSIVFNIYLKFRLDHYAAYSSELAKKFEITSMKFNATMQKLSFLNDIKKISEIIGEFSSGYADYTATDIAYTIVSESRKNNIDPYLTVAMIITESSFRYQVVSRKGAIGLMQLLPNTAFYISAKVEEIDLSHKNEIFNPVLNIKLGVNYFVYLLNKYNGDEKLAIIAYNLGPNNLNRYLERSDSYPDFYYYKVMNNYADIQTIIGRI
jgi:soluble lytic murein transglycosylase